MYLSVADSEIPPRMAILESDIDVGSCAAGEFERISCSPNPWIGLVDMVYTASPAGSGVFAHIISIFDEYP